MWRASHWSINPLKKSPTLWSSQQERDLLSFKSKHYNSSPDKINFYIRGDLLPFFFPSGSLSSLFKLFIPDDITSWTKNTHSQTIFSQGRFLCFSNTRRGILRGQLLFPHAHQFWAGREYRGWISVGYWTENAVCLLWALKSGTRNIKGAARQRYTRALFTRVQWETCSTSTQGATAIHQYMHRQPYASLPRKTPVFTCSYLSKYSSNLLTNDIFGKLSISAYLS